MKLTLMQLRQVLTFFCSIASVPAIAQLSPIGYTGAMNTPTADVIKHGHAAVSFTNAVPELSNPYSLQDNPQRSLTFGFGVLSGLELVGRLSYTGDTDCNSYYSCTRNEMRDLAASAKYQIPLQLPLGSHIALGISDYGGAATNFRQTYGVVTSKLSYLDLSLGYSKSESSSSMMHGFFGNAAVNLNDQAQLLVEHDTKDVRLGGRVKFELFSDVSLSLSASTLLKNNRGNQQEQVNVTINIPLESTKNKQARLSQEVLSYYYPSTPTPIYTHPTAESFSKSSAQSITNSNKQTKNVDTSNIRKPKSNTADLSQSLRDSYVKAGFTNIQIGFIKHSTELSQARDWRISIEPLSYRKSRHEALGIALESWLKQPLENEESLLLTLTYMQQPTITLKVISRRCLLEFKQGSENCTSGPALSISKNTPANDEIDWVIKEKKSDFLHPRLEIGPFLDNVVGTEYGVVDYSTGIQTRWEVPLGKGLFWQGIHAIPTSHSDDFGKGKYWGGPTDPRPNVGTNLLSYVFDPFKQLWVQVDLGNINSTDQGIKVSGRWRNESGRLSLAASYGDFEGYHSLNGYIERVRAEDKGFGIKNFNTILTQATYSVLPGRWDIEATAGKFYYGDTGYRFASNHWFDDTLLSFYYRDTTSLDRWLGEGSVKFAGFAISFPLGPRASAQIGPFNLRTTDRWGTGLESMVQNPSNWILPGYGTLIIPKHGLADVTDFGRIGTDSFWAMRHRIRSAMNDL